VFQVSLICIELVGIVLNLLVFYLVCKQSLRSMDMWLAFFLTLCDIAALLDRLGEVLLLLIGGINVQQSSGLGPWLGVFIIVVLHLSTGCVGILALLRFWAIVLKRPVVNWQWCLGFGGASLSLVTWVVRVRLVGGMTLMPNQRFYYPTPYSALNGTTPEDVLGCRVMLVLWHTASILLVDVCYPTIALQYAVDLANFEDGVSSSRALRSRRNQLLIKMGALVSLYNLVLLPNVILFLADLLVKPMLPVHANLAGTLMMSITLVNPIMLLTLHYGTAMELRTLKHDIMARFLPNPSPRYSLHLNH
ncbi:hypothetical protein L0F63_005877, partial [Massospora cicadina]